MLNFDVITLFPQLIEPHLAELPFKRAIEKNIINVNLHQLRNYAIDKHGTVDDKPYGGGVGMIIRVEPIFDALSNIYSVHKATGATETTAHAKNTKKSKIIVLSPAGTEYNQKKARELAALASEPTLSSELTLESVLTSELTSKAELGLEMNNITLICGRYEGIDARVLDFGKHFGVEVEPISIGKYVLSGGEIPALAIMESVTRLLPGILEKEDAAEIESFSDSELHTVEYPQYTRPENFRGLKVPEVLLSGNHKEIEEWRKKNSQL